MDDLVENGQNRHMAVGKWITSAWALQLQALHVALAAGYITGPADAWPGKLAAVLELLRYLKGLVVWRPRAVRRACGHSCILYASTLNQARTLAPVAAGLPQGLLIHEAGPAATLVRWYGLPFLPVLLWRIWRLPPAVRSRFLRDLNAIYSAYGEYLNWRSVLSQDVRLLVLANDHSLRPRIAWQAARDSNVPVAYVQHASVGGWEPSLQFDYSFLFGRQTLEAYLGRGSAAGQVFLAGCVGRVPPPAPDGVVGICPGLADPIDNVIATAKVVAADHRVIRPHPRDPRVEDWRHAADQAGMAFSDSRREEGDSFIAGIATVIAGDSNILLEAVRAGRNAIRMAAGHEFSDQYGFVSSGLVRWLHEWNDHDVPVAQGIGDSATCLAWYLEACDDAASRIAGVLQSVLDRSAGFSPDWRLVAGLSNTWTCRPEAMKTAPALLQGTGPRVGFLVSQCGFGASRGDSFVAGGLARALRQTYDWDCQMILEAELPHLPADIDILVAMTHTADISAIAWPSSKRPAILGWARNHIEAWRDLPWHGAFDLILGASPAAVDTLRAGQRVVAESLPLAGDPKQFAPGVSAAAFRADICFVGHNWSADRPIAEWAQEMDGSVDFAVYGRNWSADPVASPYWRGEIAYELLNRVYASAILTLDQTLPSSRRHGIANSRLYEALLVGCLPLSDNSGASQALFDGLLPCYNSALELRELVNRYLRFPSERYSLASTLRNIVLERHTFARRAVQFAELVQGRH